MFNGIDIGADPFSQTQTPLKKAKKDNGEPRQYLKVFETAPGAAAQSLLGIPRLLYAGRRGLQASREASPYKSVVRHRACVRIR